MYKWTVIYLIRCSSDDGNQAVALGKMFDDILQHRIPKDVAIIISLNIDIGDLMKMDPAYRPPLGAGPDGITNVFYKVVPLDSAFQEDTVTNSSQFSFAPDFKGHPFLSRKSKLVHAFPEHLGFDPRSVTDVQSFLSRIPSADPLDPSAETFAAEKYLLFTWGHGAGYGLFYENDFPDDPGTPFHMLTADDLKDAINASFVEKGQKIDVVIMMDCSMQFFDTGYTLSLAKVDYFVASKKGLSWAGYNYTEIFSRLFNEPDISPADLAGHAVSSLKEIPLEGFEYAGSLPYNIITAVKLFRYEEAARTISKFAEELMKELPGNAGKIDSARDPSQISTSFRLIDFFPFVQNIQAAFGKSWNPALIKMVLDIPGNIILAEHIGQELAAHNKNRDPEACFSICLPPPKNQNKFFLTYISANAPFRTPFSKKYKWSEFAAKFV